MPKDQRDPQMVAQNPLIAEQLGYDRLGKVNNGGLFFLNGAGGTGRSVVYNAVCATLRGNGKIVLCVSSSPISALLLRGGRTAHSMFKIPIEGLGDRSVCAIPKNSDRAELMRATAAIIWDEVGAQHRLAIEAVDRTLRNLRSSDRPFGGITVILGGDFCQTLPVEPGGSVEGIVDATIQRSNLWATTEVLHLHKNKGLDRADADAQRFAKWLLDIGEGRLSVDNDNIHLPDSWIVPNADALLDSIYPGINSAPAPPPNYFLNRLILAPRNADVQELNEKILDRMPGQARQYIAADSIIQEAGANPTGAEFIPLESLRSINAPTFPPGELNLKVGCPVVLLKNLGPTRGLCIGTRLIVTRMGDRVMEVRLIGGDHDGELVLIPRLPMISPASTGLPFQFKRLQFPLRLAFTLNINEVQGQSVRHVGLDLRMPAVSYRQFFDALSRVTCSRDIKVLLPDDANNSLTL